MYLDIVRVAGSQGKQLEAHGSAMETFRPEWEGRFVDGHELGRVESREEVAPVRPHRAGRHGVTLITEPR